MEVQSYLLEIKELSQMLQAEKGDEDIETLQKTIEELRLERDKLLENLGRTHKREEDYKENFIFSQKECESLKEDISRLEQTTEKLKIEDLDKTQVITELKIQGTFLQDNLLKVTADFNVVSSEKQRLLKLTESQAGALLQLKTSLQEDFDKERQSLLESISQLQDDKKEIQNAQDLNNSGFKEMELTFKSDKSKLHSQVESLTRDNLELKKSLDNSVNGLTSYKSKRSQLKEEIVKLKNELGVFHKDITVKDIQFINVVDQQERTQKLAQKVPNILYFSYLFKDKERLEAEVATLQKQIMEYFEKDKIKRDQDFTNSSRANEESFKNVLLVLQEEIGSAKKSRDQAEAVLATKKNRWKQAKGELHSTIKLQTSQLDIARTHIQDLQGDNAAMQLELQNKNKDMQILQGNVDELKKQIQLEKLQEESAIKQNQLIHRQMKELQKDVENYVQRIESLTKERDGLKLAYQLETAQALSSLQQQLEEEKSSNLNLRVSAESMNPNMV
jgi:chromosome segregation ATPase